MAGILTEIDQFSKLFTENYAALQKLISSAFQKKKKIPLKKWKITLEKLPENL